MDINTEFIAWAVEGRSTGRGVTIGVEPFKSRLGAHEPKAKDRLRHVDGAVRAVWSEVCKLNELWDGIEFRTRTIKVRIEEPVIGAGARSSMLVGLFNGAVYGCLMAFTTNVDLMHPSTWTAEMRSQLGIESAISSKEHVRRAIDLVMPEVTERIKQYPKGQQQDLYDAVGIATGGS